MKLGIQIALALAIVALSYFVYDSIYSKIQFEKETQRRKDLVVERLKDIRTTQITYKNTKGYYADNFDSLVDFVKYGKMSIIKQIGDADDSLQVAQGLVIRDTIYISVSDTLFSKSQVQGRLRPFHIDSMSTVPFSGGQKFVLNAGEIEKNKVKVKVFEAFASFENMYKGLNTANHSIKLHEGLRVGSMTEPSTSGNWE
ncbi:MAG: hypothetical protein H0X62_05115 [Bacteroidetes bacterium]|nr:hypothetical protein [Bacteroidota bacterium]